MMKDSRLPIKIEHKATAVLLVLLCGLLWQDPSPAQDANSSPAAGVDSAQSIGPALDVKRGNPLEKLFTPPNQWSTPQTVLNPQPPAPDPGELNPLRNLFTPMVQWSTPQTLQNPQAGPPDGEVSHLKNVFTPPNQWSTPQTVLNPQAVPPSLVPERELLWGSDDRRNELLLEHRANTLGSASSPPAVLAPGAVAEQTQKSAAQPKKAQSAAKSASKAPDSTKTSSKESAIVPAEPSKNGLTVPPPPVSQPAGGAKADSPLKMSLSLMRSGDNERSLQLLNQIIGQHPADASARYLKAVALVRMKQYKAAAEEYNEVIRLSPGTRLSTYAREGLTKIGL
jgi:hypothetical protein